MTHICSCVYWVSVKVCGIQLLYYQSICYSLSLKYSLELRYFSIQNQDVETEFYIFNNPDYHLGIEFKIESFCFSICLFALIFSLIFQTITVCGKQKTNFS